MCTEGIPSRESIDILDQQLDWYLINIPIDSWWKLN